MGLKIFDKASNLLSYNQFRLICDVVLGYAGTYCLVSPFISSEVVDVMLPINLGLSILYFGIDSNKTKDVLEIRSIYDEVIRDYNKINRDFCFTNPTEIGSMFDFALHAGYLSKDHKWNFGVEEARDIRAIYGANIINGTGVCRHTAMMLRDVYRDYGLPSNILGVYARRISPGFEIKMDVLGKSREELEALNEKVSYGDGSLEHFKKLMNHYYDQVGQHFFLRFELEEKKWNSPSSNHAITVVSDNDKVYFYDASQSRIYSFNSDNRKCLCDVIDDKVDIDLTKNNILTSDDLRQLKKQLTLPGADLDEEYERIMTTKKLFNGNLDIFEGFYSTHKEAYSEISDKMEKIKKRKVMT